MRVKIYKNVLSVELSVRGLGQIIHKSIVLSVLRRLEDFLCFAGTVCVNGKIASDKQVCGNANCKTELIEKLINSPKMEFRDSIGKKVTIPTMRACPRCQTMLEHTGGCNTFTCSSSICKHIFCFICLSASKSCKSISWNETGIRCSPAPIQTKLK